MDKNTAQPCVSILPSAIGRAFAFAVCGLVLKLYAFKTGKLIRTSQERVQLDQQLQVDVVGLGSFSVARSGMLLGSVVSTHVVCVVRRA